MNLNDLNNWGHPFDAVCIEADIVEDDPETKYVKLASVIHEQLPTLFYCHKPEILEGRIKRAWENRNKWQRTIFNKAIPPIEVHSYKDFPTRMLEDIDLPKRDTFALFPPNPALTNRSVGIVFGVSNWTHWTVPKEWLGVFVITVDARIELELLKHWGLWPQLGAIISSF